jgi:predicted nucleic acid-binding protein
MLVVDSSVWIDFFRDAPTRAVAALTELLQTAKNHSVVPDLVLYEVLRGFRRESEYRAAKRLMEGFGVEAAFDAGLAVEAANHYRAMVSRGFTIRSALDVMIGAFCIERGYALLHNDSDFDTMHELRGLKVYA